MLSTPSKAITGGPGERRSRIVEDAQLGHVRKKRVHIASEFCNRERVDGELGVWVQPPSAGNRNGLVTASSVGGAPIGFSR